MTKRIPVWLSSEELIEVLAWGQITHDISSYADGQPIDQEVYGALRDAWVELNG